MTLAAARDDQFLVEQDLHEAAAPMDALLRNRDHRAPRQAVPVGHCITIFVPEPESVTVTGQVSRPPQGRSQWPLTGLCDAPSTPLKARLYRICIEVTSDLYQPSLPWSAATAGPDTGAKNPWIHSNLLPVRHWAA